jgi:hypothetical protein
MSLRRIADRMALALLGALPARALSHLMFLLREQRAIADRAGWHLRPIHYHEPLPDFAALTPARLDARFPATGLSLDISAQAARAVALLRERADELSALAQGAGETGFDFANDWFAGLDAALFYALLRDLRPARLIEVGGGWSTRIAAAALARNRAEGAPCRHVCVEPFPQPRLTDAALDVTLERSRLEDLDPAFFDQLGAGDVLFIDSSHVANSCGDVVFAFLRLLPALRPGVVVHVHDIFLPTDYPADWLIERRIAFNEQYLAHAFLLFNSAFETFCCARWLALDHARELRAAAPAIWRAGERPSSLWMRRVA